MSKNKDLGIINTYTLARTDGKQIPKQAEFFVLRLDSGQKDKIHMEACRKALLTYAYSVKHHLPQLSKELIEKYQ